MNAHQSCIKCHISILINYHIGISQIDVDQQMLEDRTNYKELQIDKLLNRFIVMLLKFDTGYYFDFGFDLFLVGFGLLSVGLMLGCVTFNIVSVKFWLEIDG